MQDTIENKSGIEATVNDKEMKKRKILSNRIIGIDYGFGYTKACDELGSQVKFISLFKKYIEPKIVQDVEQEYLVTIEMDGSVEKYQVGEFAKVGDVTKQWDRTQATNPLNMKIFIGTALNLIANENISNYPVSDDNAIHVNLSVGLPIDFYKSQKTELENILKDMKITVEINKNKNIFIIDSLLISQQGVGAFFAFAYNKNGIERSLEEIAEELEKYTIVNSEDKNKPLDYKSIAKQIVNFGLGFGDIGYNTLDCFKIVKKNNQLIIIDESAFSIENKGLHNYHELALKNIIMDRGNIVRDVLDCETALEETEGEIKYGKHLIDIKPYFDEVYKILSDDFKNFINQKWGDINDLGAMLLCGGGSYVLENKLDLEINAFIMKNGEYANALGYVIKMIVLINKMKNRI